MPPYPFRFSPLCDDEWRGGEGVRTDPTCQEGMGEPEVEIRFPRELPESGWRLILQSGRKVQSCNYLHKLLQQSNTWEEL